MKNAANAHTILPEESVLIMYSGGLDSTVAATQMARSFRRVVLMTIDYPFTIGLNNSTRNTEKLKIAFPHCSITHHIMDGKDIRRRIWGRISARITTPFARGVRPASSAWGARLQ